MSTIEGVRWYLNDDKRSYGRPWEPYIERSLLDGLSEFATAAVVVSYWQDGIEPDEDAKIAVQKLAKRLEQAKPASTASGQQPAQGEPDAQLGSIVAAEGIINVHLKMPWRRACTVAEINHSPVPSEGEAKSTAVGTLFAAIVRRPTLSPEDIRAIVGSADPEKSKRPGSKGP